MVNKMLFSFASVALMVASAASGHDVKIYSPVTVSGAKLAPGTYRFEVNGSTAVIRNGKKVAEVPVKVENADEKYQTNTLRLDGDRIAEIGLAGTHTKLVFDQTGDATK